MRMKTLEDQVSELIAENNELKVRLNALEIEKKKLEKKNLTKLNKIKTLEHQLSEAHQTIMDRS